MLNIGLGFNPTQLNATQCWVSTLPNSTQPNVGSKIGLWSDLMKTCHLELRLKYLGHVGLVTHSQHEQTIYAVISAKYARIRSLD